MTPGSRKHRLACRHKLHNLCHVLCKNMAELSSGVAALLDNVSRSSAPACKQLLLPRVSHEFEAAASQHLIWAFCMLVVVPTLMGCKCDFGM